MDDSAPPVDAVLDANVLLPAPLRDTLLRAADAGLYFVHWTEDILQEMERNLIGVWHLSEAQAQRATGAMREAFPEALVTDHTALIERMPNHPKDRHVLAAAVACGTSVIVTHNLRDFPQQALAAFNVQAQSPDEFLLWLHAADADTLIQVIVEQAQDLRKSPKTALDVVNMLAKHAPTFADLVRGKLPIP